MKNLYKKITICLLVIVFSLTFICVKFKGFGRKFFTASYSQYFNGDLYSLGKLDCFSEDIPLAPLSENSNKLEDSAIITMGDSFFTANYESKILPEILEEKSNKPLYNLDRDLFATFDDNPLVYFKNIDYKKDKPKTLVLESVERYVIERSFRYLSDEITKIDDNKLPIERYLDPVKNFLPQPNLEYFAYNSLLFDRFYKLGNTFRFNVYNKMDSRIGAYSNNPKNLFLKEELDFANRDKNQDVIEVVANNILSLKNTLKEKYNIDLIFLLIPNKYSMYSETANISKEYDNFIPKLTKSLQDKGVKAPDIYSLYKDKLKEDPEVKLYYSSDTHYAKAAKEIAADTILYNIQN